MLAAGAGRGVTVAHTGDKEEPAMQDALTATGLSGLAKAPLHRRGMVMTGLISGLTLATARVDAQVIHTDANGLFADEVRIPVAGGEIPAYAARPQTAGPFPTVLVIEEIFGVHDYIKDVCRRLAHLGYLAVAPELYSRLGDLSQMSDVQQIIRDVISKAPDATVLSDLDSTAAWAAHHDGNPKRLAVIGFCRGGRDVWLYAAHNPNLRCAVAWYGPVADKTSPIQPRNATAVAAELKCPLLGLYGDKDTGISPFDVRVAAERAVKAGKTVEIVFYADAGHGFHADYRPSYNPVDAADGWQRMLAWFKQYGM
jgi:carboxymethylenebutenolidase